jgi:ABC-type polysaccharide/polyol phosphate transport system ATPase subunit
MSSEGVSTAGDVAIEVAGLSKCYPIYDKPQHRLLQGLFRHRRQFFREFWALKDVGFRVRRGETLGIVGRNGSGKSTLLQILCGTLQATAGAVTVNGRVGALLELGAGFNPEFTGRDNVYLNGALMGMSRRTIDNRFPEIAAFADIGEFIDQPVKTYSSGMYVRLAFAVTIAASPDILVVDEALSVGDMAFQNKCMAHIRRLSDAGKTIVFVSHDLSTSQVLCTHALWLDRGQVAAIGPPVEVFRQYYVASLGEAAQGEEASTAIPQQETGMARFVDVSVVRTDLTRDLPVYQPGERVRIRFTMKATARIEASVIALSVYRSDGDWLIGQSSREAGVEWPAIEAGQTLSGDIDLDPLSLAPGEYRIAVGAYSADLAICNAMTGILPGFAVRSNVPTWGKFLHGIRWTPAHVD